MTCMYVSGSSESVADVRIQDDSIILIKYLCNSAQVNARHFLNLKMNNSAHIIITIIQRCSTTIDCGHSLKQFINS